MKLSNAIDLFRRRFVYYLKDDPILRVDIILSTNNPMYIIEIDHNVTDDGLVAMSLRYNRMLEDVPEVAIHVVKREYKTNQAIYPVWTRDGGFAYNAT